jgi:hypothetical protein
LTKKRNSDIESEIRNILINVAKRQELITYKELASLIRSHDFTARSLEMHRLLTSLSLREKAMGRGLLSAVVVQSREYGMPGAGFFTQLGETVPKKDRRKRWLKDLAKVYETSRSHQRPSVRRRSLYGRSLSASRPQMFIN